MVDVLIVAAAVLTALGVIWRKGLRPIIHAARRAEETLPVILSIAEQFKANGGSSLRDTLEQLGRDANELSQYAHGFRHEFVNKFTVLEGNQLLQAERLAALGAEVSEIKDDLAGVKNDVGEVKTMVDRREEPR